MYLLLNIHNQIQEIDKVGFIYIAWSSNYFLQRFYK